MAVRDSYLPSRNNFGVRDRSRGQYVPEICGYDYYNSPSSTGSFEDQVYYSGSFQRTIDYDLGAVYRVLKGQNRFQLGASRLASDYGHPFWSEVTSVSKPTFSIQGIDVPYATTRRFGRGSLYPCQAATYAAANLKTIGPAGADLQGMSFSDMWTYGGIGIAACLPGVPPVSLFQLLGELREGAPKMLGSTFVDWTAFRRAMKLDPRLIKGIFSRSSPLRTGKGNVGSEYLNVMFGVMPALSSVAQLIDLSQNYDAVKARIDDEARTSIRRRRTVFRDKTTTFTRKTNAAPVTMLHPAQGFGVLDTEDTVEQKVWVACAFNHRPAALALNKAIMQLSSSLPLGLMPNAANLWELVPFSWLVDYFTSVGSLMKNLSYMDVNGVGLSYAYVMCETTRTTRWTWSGSFRLSNTIVLPITTTVVRKVVTKQRQKASPLGFGFKPTGLSAHQLAILAALGISRSKLP